MTSLDLTEDISEQELARWLSPPEARTVLQHRRGWSSEQATRAILTRLAASLVRAAAECVVFTQAKKEERRYRRFVPYHHWDPDSEWLYLSDFWDTGDIYFDVTDGSGYMISTIGRISYFGVRFDPVTIEAMAPAPQQPTPLAPIELVPINRAAQAVRNPGGRPRKEYWEPLLIEIFDQLWHGSLIPKTQADIEKAMDDWLCANGYSASERSIRQRARSIWNVWIKEGNN